MAADDTLYTELQNAGSVTVTPASDWQVTSCGDAVSVPITDWIHPAAMKDPESFMAAIQRPDGRRDTLAMPDERDREIIMLRAERDLWKGLHGDLVAKFSATTPAPEPKSAPEHDPFRDFSGDPRRMGR